MICTRLPSGSLSLRLYQAINQDQQALVTTHNEYQAVFSHALIKIYQAMICTRLPSGSLSLRLYQAINQDQQALVTTHNEYQAIFSHAPI